MDNLLATPAKYPLLRIIPLYFVLYRSAQMYYHRKWWRWTNIDNRALKQFCLQANKNTIQENTNKIFANIPSEIPLGSHRQKILRGHTRRAREVSLSDLTISIFLKFSSYIPFIYPLRPFLTAKNPETKP